MRQRTSVQRVLTFLHTDVEESTAALRRLGPRYAESLEEHRRLLGRVATDLGGRQVDAVGDSVLLVFPEPNAAARAAMIGQLGLAGLPRQGEEGLRVRMGLHTGPAWKRGRSFYGLTVHKVARISSLAQGGQILLSAETALSLDDLAPLRRHSECQLAGFEGPEPIYELLVFSAPPPMSTQALVTPFPQQ